jgi:alkanesulfonate monooxygenase SsuD/methylene tetrahydromethanopterin reductase-like flavin-dependent oxidoreductase (luciferase family)
VARGLRIGVQLPEVERHVGWPEYVAMARAAEEVGLDSVWVGDHLLYRGDGREERGPWDAWTLLAGIAAVTTRIRIGPLVACTAFATAGLLARKAAAVQAVSDGRLVLALGAGWNETEFRAFGLPFDQRASRFEEAFDVIRRLLSGERVTMAGRFERLDDAVLLPRPDRPELMVGSTGKRVLRATLPHVDAWNAWYAWFGNTPAGFAQQNARVSEIARDVGRDPREIRRTAAVFVDAGGGSDDRPHTAGADTIRGSAEQVAARLAEFHDAGLDEAIVVLNPITEASVRFLGEVVAA